MDRLQEIATERVTMTRDLIADVTKAENLPILMDSVDTFNNDVN